MPSQSATYVKDADAQAFVLGAACALQPPCSTMHAGQRCDVGHGKNTYGTGCFLLVNTGDEAVMSKAGLLSTLAFQLGPNHKAAYALEGSIGIAGMAITWLRDQLGLIQTIEEAEELAAQVPDTGAANPMHMH